MERMKQLTVCVDDGLQGEVVYRVEISHTEEDFQELKSDLEFVREENKKLREENKKLEEEKEFFYKSAKQFREENENLKETIKDHQLYEEKLEHRIIEFEELLHGE